MDNSASAMWRLRASGGCTAPGTEGNDGKRPVMTLDGGIVRGEHIFLLKSATQCFVDAQHSHGNGLPLPFLKHRQLNISLCP
jgi:hypothetical protein